ncbi:hypothetical protein [uncultured Halopseudomonas sp.]|uniref:hypothetical protein n=1 Tax=uncultured Halopseudomonas sp. TaxID=2901193 RepID=UPI0030EEDDB7
MRTCRHMVLLWLWLFAMYSRADTLLVVMPASTALTSEFVSELVRERTGDQVLVHNLDSNSSSPAVKADYIVTMGVASLEWQLARGESTPTLATYISRSGLEEATLQSLPANVSVVLANPKPERQLRLARMLIPRLRTAALLHSPNKAEQINRWESAAGANDVKLNMAELTSPENLARTLVSALDRSDVLMGLDDQSIYNADNLKTILLTSYTRNRVLIGPSAPFIAAGSLSTTFSSPADMARSVDYLIEHSARPSSLEYPRFFSVLSNQQVARSMGFAPPNDAELAAELARMENVR